MEKEKIYQQIYNEIKNKKRILILTHRRPDGDALGSLCAFYGFIKNFKKEAVAYCIDCPNGAFNFLAHVGEIKFSSEISDFSQFDLIFCLDCGDLNQTGLQEVLFSLKGKALIINIDHHLTNTHFGDLNLIEAGAASTTEILADFFSSLKIKISREQATCLLVGLFSDTDNFSNSATTQRAFSLAAELLTKGISLKRLNSFEEKNKNLALLRLWGEILSRLEKNKKYNIATTVITSADVARYNIKEEALAGVANFFNNLTGVKATLILKEDDFGKIRGSFRTTNEEIDVSKLAKILGGGGHKKAAGFSVDGRLTKTKASWQIN